MANVFETSLFQRELNLVLNSGSKPVHFYLEAKLHSPAGTITATVVKNFTIKRNYVTKAFDIRELEIEINEGQYEKYMVPYKDELEVTIKKTPLLDKGRTVDVNTEPETYRYRAVLFDPRSAIMEGNNIQLQDERVSQLAVLKTVKIQLMDLVVEQMRLITVGGVFRRAIPSEVIRVILGKYSKRVSLPESSYTVLGVDVAPNYNEQVRQAYVIPHLTPLFDVPGYIHKHCGGVYSGGFGCYYQENMWYIYPPYDVTRYPATQRTLTVINVPKNRLPQPERTYRLTSTQIIALCTDDVKHIDDSEKKQLNEGNGVRFAHAGIMFNRYGQTGGNKMVVKRGNNISEFVYEERKTGVNILKESKNRITDNLMYEYGQIAPRTGAFMMLVWEGSISKFVYPGMPTRLLYMENGVANEVYGCVVDVEVFSVPISQGYVDVKFMEKCVITLFIDRKVVFEQLP